MPGRSDEKANWEDAERSLVHWRALQAEELQTAKLEDMDIALRHTVASQSCLISTYVHI